MCVLLLLPLAAQQKFDLQAPDFRFRLTEKGFDRIDMDGYSAYGVPGYPDLPSRILHVAIPPDADIGSVRVYASVNQTSGLGVYRIQETPRMAVYDSGKLDLRR